ncbi:unnamed protein product, partial [Amoebophrya sp. A25]
DEELRKILALSVETAEIEEKDRKRKQEEEALILAACSMDKDNEQEEKETEEALTMTGNAVAESTSTMLIEKTDHAGGQEQEEKGEEDNELRVEEGAGAPGGTVAALGLEEVGRAAIEKEDPPGSCILEPDQDLLALAAAGEKPNETSGGATSSKAGGEEVVPRKD